MIGKNEQQNRTLMVMEGGDHTVQSRAAEFSYSYIKILVFQRFPTQEIAFEYTNKKTQHPWSYSLQFLDGGIYVESPKLRSI